LNAGGFAFLPQGVAHSVRAPGAARAAVIEKPYEPIGGEEPVAEIVVGNEDAISPVALMGDEALRVRSLMPDGPAYDFAVNTMTYDPGAALSMVEIHVMEHGLLMLEGGGIYRLGDAWYPVEAGDFIWMGPYCPQWFGALGKRPAKYLIYKDWRRHPLGG
jgi:(S)-ureidoglycine aminohydrolase